MFKDIAMIVGVGMVRILYVYITFPRPFLATTPVGILLHRSAHFGFVFCREFTSYVLMSRQELRLKLFRKLSATAFTSVYLFVHN